jgi:dTMP kinase
MGMGKLIALEGLDNSGKTSVAHRLKSELERRSFSVSLAREFSTPVGPLLHDLLPQLSPTSKIFLFAAERALLLENAIPILERGTHVVFDRYFYSAIAYRTAEGLDPNYVRIVNSVFRTPDLAILLDIDVDMSMARETPSKAPTPYNCDELERVRSAYLQLAEIDGLVVVDARRPLQTVVDEVVEIVLRQLAKE